MHFYSTSTMPEIDILILVAVVLAALRRDRVVQHKFVLTGDLYFKVIVAPDAR